MNDRIRQLLEYSGLNQNMFADKIAVAPATLSNILKGKTKLSLDIAMNVREAFPNLNTFWLLDGKGEMFLTPGEGKEQDNGQADASALEAQDSFSGVAPSSPSSLSSTALGTGVSAGTGNVAGTAFGSSSFALNPNGRLQPGYGIGQHLDNAKDLQMVKIIDKPTRKVREIQVFYDDDTYEVFVPRK